ncbi:helix-turn-helix domain-containing protein [Rhodococcus sp. MSC1_016]|uniref:helix-turn-helix domain-containing protein n=2 Tax=unclassified Rhodococcus (in: high G+C Gram-positive bacteria) TaxID=192944 RepID=UPI002030DD52|nr:helix-turn-helix domain-containing protein [Rhodococcus sp. MSC1_016]
MRKIYAVARMRVVKSVACTYGSIRAKRLKGWAGTMSSFAERLRYLFDTVHPKDRGPYTQTEVVDMLRFSGSKMTTGYMSQLLSGKRSSPGLETVRDICRVFRVPMDYFGDEETYQEIKQQIEWIQNLRDSQDQRVAARTYDPFRKLTSDED